MQNILVIDDSEFDRRMIVSAMKACANVNCVELAQGDGVIEAMRSEEPQLTIVDIRMPGMSGWDVLDKIKADVTLRDFNVVMMSGSHSQEDIAMANLKGASGFYTKPHKKSDYTLVATDIKNTYLSTAA